MNCIQLSIFAESVNEVKLVGTVGANISDEKATSFSLHTHTNITYVFCLHLHC